MEDCAELTDHKEAWPEDPELVEETDILGRCEYGKEGGIKTPLSDSLTVISDLSGIWPDEVGADVHGAVVVSAMGSLLISMLEPVGVVVDEAPLGDVEELADEGMVPGLDISDGERTGGGGGGP